MPMRQRNKATAWKREGLRGCRISKRLANVIERRKAKELEKQKKEQEEE